MIIGQKYCKLTVTLYFIGNIQ